MKIGMFISRMAERLPVMEVFRGYDRVAVMASVESLPEDGRFVKLPDTPLDEDFVLFDEWATRLADALRRDGRPLSIREREYYRIAIQDFLQGRLGNAWISATRHVSGLEMPRGSAILLIVEDPVLRACLAAWGRARGFECRAEESELLFSGPGKSGKGGRTATFITAGVRLLAASRASLSRWSGILKSRFKRHDKLMFACVGHQDDYEFFDYVLRELYRRGYEVVLVDIRRWKSGRVISHPPYPYVHFWSLPSLLGFGVRGRHAPLSLARDAFTDLPVANELTLGALASLIANATEFHARCRAASLSLWRHLKPSAILMMQEGAEMACMAGVAAEQGIATVDLAHAIQPPKSRSYAYDALAVFGPDNVRTHILREPPPASCEVVAVGACRYDKIVHRDYPDAKVTRAELDLPMDRPVILFASQYLWKGDARLGELKGRVARWLSEAVPQDAVLVLKKHPLEEDTICEEILRPVLGCRLRVARLGNIYALLNISSAVVVMWSNTGLEAVLMNKPVIAVPGEGACPLPYMTHGLCRFAHSADEMRAEIGQALKRGAGVIPDYEERRKRFVAEVLTAHDGQSSVRLANLIERKVTSLRCA